MTTQNDCSRHSWLVPPGEEGGQTCQRCADDAETARVLAGPARTYTADEMRAAFVAGTCWDAMGDLDKAASAYVAGLEG